MPELPEVEAARRAVHESCCGRRIVEASIADDSIVIDKVVPLVLERALVGRTILGAHRKGKNIWLELDARPWPSFQFGMTGAFNIKGREVTKYKRAAVSDKEEWPSKFSKVLYKLDDGLEVSFTDKRRLARVRLLDDPIAGPPISELGPDAFLELPVETSFISSILKKRCPIKVLLMDQSFVAGIGNWVADEVLYQARIHPEQVASSLSENECTRLHKTIQEVLKHSVDVNADSEMFPKEWIFHYRWNKKPGEVGGEKISFITVGGRTSAIVSALQKCTSQLSRKKLVTADAQVEDKGTENDTSIVQKKRGRKKQTSKSDDPSDDEDIVPKQAVKKSRSSAKDVLTASKAEIKKGRGRKLPSKIMEEEEKIEVGGLKEKTAGRASKTQNNKEESSGSQHELAKKQGMSAAKKRPVKKKFKEEAIASGAPTTDIEVGNKGSAKSTKRLAVNGNKEELELDKEKGSSKTKRKQRQKRKKGVK